MRALDGALRRCPGCIALHRTRAAHSHDPLCFGCPFSLPRPCTHQGIYLIFLVLNAFNFDTNFHAKRAKTSILFIVLCVSILLFIWYAPPSPRDSLARTSSCCCRCRTGSECAVADVSVVGVGARVGVFCCCRGTIIINTVNCPEKEFE